MVLIEYRGKKEIHHSGIKNATELLDVIVTEVRSHYFRVTDDDGNIINAVEALGGKVNESKND